MGVAAVILCRSHGDRWGRLCAPILQSHLRCVPPNFMKIEISSQTLRDVSAIHDERNFVAEYIMRFNSFQFCSL